MKHTKTIVEKQSVRKERIDIIKGFALSAALVALTVMFAVLAVRAIGIRERSRCYEWQSQAQSMPGFFLTKSQHDQCEYYQVTVHAPVR